MRYQAFVRAAAGGLLTALFAAGAAMAQTATQPEPKTMTDIAPLPPGDRDSSGAVILQDQPVLAQQEAMAAQARAVDTRALGAGPARLEQRARTQQEIEFQRALDAALRRYQTPQ